MDLKHQETDISGKHISDIFQPNIFHYNIPHFQRNYVWNDDNWGDLWETLLKASNGFSGKKFSENFLGTIVIYVKNLEPPLKCSIIDGQQRLVTLSLILAAMRDMFSKDIGLGDKINKNILMENQDLSKNVFNSIIRLSNTDSESYNTILNRINIKKPDDLISLCYNYYFKKFEENGDKIDPDHMHTALIKYLLFSKVVIKNPSGLADVFQTINSHGRPIEDLDYIRCILFSEMDEPKFEQLYKKWEDLEKSFKNELDETFRTQDSALLQYIKSILLYLGHTIKSGNDERRNKTITLKALEEWINSPEIIDRETRLIEFIQILDKNKNRYISIKEPSNLNIDDISITHELQLFRIIKRDAFIPFILQCIDKFNIFSNPSTEEKQSFLSILKMIQSYYIRHSICEGPISDTIHNNELCTRIIQSHLVSPIDHCKEVLGKNLPDDTLFVNRFKESDLYQDKENQILKYALIKIEEFLSKSTNFLNYNKLTIEHILPQNPSKLWKDEVNSKNFDACHQKWYQTIGNLTLVPINSELGNLPFISKKGIYFNDSTLTIHKIISKSSKWWIDEIKENSDYISAFITDIWCYFGGPNPCTEAKSGYDPIQLTIKGNPYQIRNWVQIYEKTIFLMATYNYELFNRVIERYPNDFSLNSNRIKNCKKVTIGNNTPIFFKNQSGLTVYKKCQNLRKGLGWSRNDWIITARNKEDGKLTQFC